jgi:hypothetical protein
MMLAFVLGAALAVVAVTLVRQWLSGALTEDADAPVLTPAQFPHLAPPARVRTVRSVRSAPGSLRRAA